VKLELFRARLELASERAREFAGQWIEERLPEPLRFRVRLNQSYDGDPLHADERVFPEDSDAEIAPALADCSLDEVVATLWREGLVPEWIDASVIGEREHCTLIELRCCGRFTANDELLYHREAGRPPFQVVGPTLPVDHEQGRKFSIYDRSECWTRAELDHVARHSSKVWSLVLRGSEFDDDALAGMPSFDRLEILELLDSPLRGPGFASLARQPRLRIVRITLAKTHQGVSLESLPRLEGLDELTLRGLPCCPEGLSRLPERAPRLARLELASDAELVVDATWPRSLSSITLRASRLQSEALPPNLTSICLDLREADVEHLLVSVLKVSLVRRAKLEYLDLGKTPASEALLGRIAARFPALRRRGSSRWRARSTVAKLLEIAVLVLTCSCESTGPRSDNHPQISSPLTQSSHAVWCPRMKCGSLDSQGEASSVEDRVQGTWCDCSARGRMLQIEGTSLRVDDGVWLQFSVSDAGHLIMPVEGWEYTLITSDGGDFLEFTWSDATSRFYHSSGSSCTCLAAGKASAIPPMPLPGGPRAKREAMSPWLEGVTPPGWACPCYNLG